MKKTAFTALLLALILLLTACSAPAPAAPATSAEIAEACETNSYLYQDSTGLAFCFVTIKNNTSEPIFADGVASGMDAEGSIVSASAASVNVIGPGEESGCYFLFDYADDIEYVDHSFEYSTEVSCKPVLSTLEIEQSVSGSDVTVTVKNKGKYPAQQLECYVLFLDADGNVTEFASDYMTPSTELLRGKTAEKTFSAAGDFADVKVFFVGGFYC